jgi:hypothetical protein
VTGPAASASHIVTTLRVPSLRITLASLTLAALTLVSGCASPVEPRDAVRFVPPSWYRALYEHDVQCSGLTRAFDDLAWSWVPGSEFSYDGHVDVGLTNGASGRIYLSEAYLTNPVVVRHEMLHALLRDAGGHPPKYFDVRCPLMWSNYYATSNSTGQWVDDSIMAVYEHAHGGLLDVPGKGQ